jgi:hypothetical protein
MAANTPEGVEFKAKYPKLQILDPVTFLRIL